MLDLSFMLMASAALAFQLAVIRKLLKGGGMFNRILLSGLFLMLMHRLSTVVACFAIGVDVDAIHMIDRGAFPLLVSIMLWFGIRAYPPVSKCSDEVIDVNEAKALISKLRNASK